MGFFLLFFFRSDPLTAVRECEDELLLINVAIEAEPFEKYSIFLSASEMGDGWESFAAVLHKDAAGQGECKGHGESEKVMFWL